jgi:predicted ATPase
MASDTFQSITIEGFKSIRSIKDLNLRPISVLIGANGSGKTNFLDAFVLLDNALTHRMDAYAVEQGGASHLLHYGPKVTQDIRVSLSSNTFKSLRTHYVYLENDRIAGSRGYTGTVGAPMPSFRRYQFNDTSKSSPLKRTNQVDDNRFLHTDGRNLATFLYLLKQKHQKSYDLICKTIQQVAPFFDDFQLEPLALNPNTIKLEWRHVGTDDYFDASSFSDGTLRFIALTTLFLQPVELRPSVILVDEPELGLHPSAIELLASLIKQASKETQVIAATQSSLLLDQFDPEDVLVADRVDGATTIKRLEPEPLAEWLKEYSLGQLWEKGELAGRPGKE